MVTKQLFFGTILILSLLVYWSPTASAHVLKVDGDIGAVLHINPDDSPTTDTPTDYILSFDDDSGRFSLPQCTCTVSIIEQGKTIATQQLKVAGSEVSENHYTFLKSDIYIMRIMGTPKRPNTFQPFVLNYVVRVTNGQTETQPVPLLLWIGMGMTVGLLLTAAYTSNADIHRNKSRTKGTR